MITRNYLRLSMLACFLWSAAVFAASRVERGDLIFDNIPESAMEPADRLDGYLAARQATSWGWSPKGQLLISTRFGDVEQLHVVEKAGGERRQITFLHQPISGAVFSPDPVRNAYVFAMDLDGGERVQLYYQRVGQPVAKLLTDGKSLNGGAVWSNSGREVAFFSTARDGVSYDIDVAEPETGTLPHLAVTGDGASWRPLDWSPDDRKLLVLKTVSAGEAYLYVVDLSSGQKREVDPAAPAKIGVGGAKFSRDGQGVYMISDRDAEFAKLRYVNLFTGEKTLISGPIAGDVEDLALSRDGHYLAYTGNEGALSKLDLVDLRAHQELTPPRLPPGIIGHLSFDAEGRRLAFDYTTATLPRDAYVLDVASNHVEAWTQSEPGAVDTAKFAAPRLAEFPTFDRQDGHTRQEPVYVYEPTGTGPHPVLVLLHDGPASQFRPSFDPWIQYLVNEMGFAVVAPNVRGSSGYGKTYQALDNGMLRDDAVKDLGALIVWLSSQPAFNPKHVVVAGDGYGGYLALAALVNYGDRLVGGVEVAGAADLISFLTNMAPYAQARQRMEFGDERDPDMRAYLRRISPLTNADRLSRPLLVVLGRNDPMAPLNEAEQIVNRLRGRGGDVWYLQAKDEGRSFAKQSNREAFFRTFAQFLKSLR